MRRVHVALQGCAKRCATGQASRLPGRAHDLWGAYLRTWLDDETRETKIVFIGKQLPAEVFKAGLDGGSQHAAS
nr:GTP-binding protein [Candidatus Burkholderia verschuerenii]